MWTIEQGLEIVRALQPKSRDFGYHLCIGGGVVNTGRSDKDLDLFFLPMDDDNHVDMDALLDWLSSIWGSYTPIGDYSTENSNYRVKVKYRTKDNKRIDVFVVGG